MYESVLICKDDFCSSDRAPGIHLLHANPGEATSHGAACHIPEQDPGRRVATLRYIIH